MQKQPFDELERSFAPTPGSDPGVQEERQLFDELDRSLRLSRGRRRAIQRELRSHLNDARQDLQLAGTPPQEAGAQSLARLGDPEAIAEGFVAAYRRPRRRHLGLALGLAGALLLGAYGAGATLASSPHRPAPHRPVPQHLMKQKPVLRLHAQQVVSGSRLHRSRTHGTSG